MGCVMAIWAKVDANLHTNPKCMAAGFWGTWVFQQLLLVHKTNNLRGTIPASMAQPGYLARLTGLDSAPGLAVTAVTVVTAGLHDATQANLLAKNPDGSVRLVGWDASWSRSLDDSAPRVQAMRERQKAAKPQGADPDVTDVTDVTRNGAVTNVTNVTLEENRGEQNRGESPYGPPAGDAQPKPKSKKKTKAEKLLAKWGEDAGRLWDLQEVLRAGVMPRSSILEATEERLAPVCERLEAGVKPEDLETVLHAYAAEVRRNPSSGKWFNGETNWRKANVTRALGSVGADRSAERGGGGNALRAFADFVDATVDSVQEAVARE